MSETIKNTLDGLNLTDDEIQRFSKAFQDDEFKKLFKEYAEEISNPENRKRYEDEIRMMEADRGMDVEFVHPTPGYVIKTTVNGKSKAFINIATNDHVGKPSHQRSAEQGKSGLVWSIPHLFAHPREDLDKSKRECRVYDVVFHPDTYRMAESNALFRKIVEDTALEGIEKQFGIKVDRRNCKKPKLKYKGQPVASVIRKRSATSKGNVEEKAEKSILDDYPYPYPEGKTSEELSREMRSAVKEEKMKHEKNGTDKSDNEASGESGHVVPNYKLKYSKDLQLDDFGTVGSPLNDLQARSHRPDRVLVEIDLPLIKSAGSLDLDIGDRSLSLVSEKPAAYRLTVRFDYPVREDGGSAKFDKKTRQLQVMLPIVPDNSSTLLMAETVKSSESLNCSNDVDNVSSKLVQEIPSAEASKQKDTEIGGDLVADVECSKSASLPEEGADDPYAIDDVSNFTPPDAMKRSLPECLWREDDHFLTFLFQVHNVQLSGFRMCRMDNCVCFHIKFISLGHGGWPVDYSFFIKIEYDDEGSNGVRPFLNRLRRIDPATENLVLRLEKRSEYHGRRARGVYLSHNCIEWSCITSCTETSSKTNRLLLHEIMDLLDKTKYAHEVAENICEQSDNRCLEVSELTQQLVTISLEAVEDGAAVVDFPEFEENVPKRPGHEDGNDTASCENGGADKGHHIEVVYKNPPRPLHGILKKASSQSSESQLGEIKSDDDNYCQCSGHVSEDDIRSLHKSVSFSGKAEVTNFNVGQPVCSLHTTLKNRRRKNKRREQRRRVISGSRSTEEDEESRLQPLKNYDRNLEPRQRHYSDSILVTEGHGFIDADDFALQDSGENVSSPSGESREADSVQPPSAPFETKRRKRKKKKEVTIDANANHSKECDVSNPEETNGAKQEDSCETVRTAPDRSDDLVSKASNEHVTTCSIKLKNTTIFELDDD